MPLKYGELLYRDSVESEKYNGSNLPKPNQNDQVGQWHIWPFPWYAEFDKKQFFEQAYLPLGLKLPQTPQWMDSPF